MPAFPQASARVLIVQNEAISRELLAHLLRMSGYEPMTADTGESAFTAIRKWRGRIDCLFSVVRLPGLIDGWILGDEFRRWNPDRPVLLAVDNSLDASRRMPSVAYLITPVSPLDVLERIKGLTRPAPEAAPVADSEPPPVLLAS